MRTGGGQLDPDADDAAEAMLAAVREVVGALRLPHAVPSVNLDSHLEADLGLDSLSVAELLVRTEELFAVSLDEGTLVAVRTPRELLAAAAAAVDGVPASGDEVGQPLVTPPTSTAGAEVLLPAPLPGPHDRGGRAGGLYGAWALAAFGVVAAVAWCSIVLTPSLRLRWRLVRLAGRLLTALTGVRVRIEGADHLPRDRPFVMVANHASHVDPLFLALVLEEPAVFVAVADLAHNPLVRLGLRRLHSHLVERGDRARGVAHARTLTDVVRGGRSVVFFPEGRRSPAAGLEPFRTGAFLVAARSGAPVVPVAIRGTRDLLPVGRRLPRRSPVSLTVAPPVTTEQLGWQGAVELHHEARRRILAHCDEPDLA